MPTQADTFDLLIIGGGINGAGVARDAAGRGLRTALVEQNDFAGATSCASTKLIHGGLRYLEHFEFRLVAESLAEREVLLRLAPHLVAPQRFVMPHVAGGLRPGWMIRAGLWLYDHIGGTRSLAASTPVKLTTAGLGAGLKSGFVRGYSYSDARVDDARLVLSTIKSAQAHGATIFARTQLLSARRESAGWRATVQNRLSGEKSVLFARVLVNAAGPWVQQVMQRMQISPDTGLRLVKGSHIVVPRIHAGEHAYLLQNSDRRVIFIIPYQQHFSLIGTTDKAIEDVSQAWTISDEEMDYLLKAVNPYLARPLVPDDVVWSFSGVRPLDDDGKNNPATVTRDYRLALDVQQGIAQLSIFGGKLTTYRKLAEAVLAKLQPWLAASRGPWTDTEELPGGNVNGSCAQAVTALRQQYPWAPETLLTQWFSRHGTLTRHMLGDAHNMDDLGESFGGHLYQREVAYFITEEWAFHAEDILWRRSKAGLHMSDEQKKNFDQWLTRFRSTVHPLLKETQDASPD